MVTTCCVSACNNKYRRNSSLKFHRFPSQPKLKREWIIKLRLGKKPSKWFHVCSAHFNEEDYKINIGNNKILISGSIPSKNIPRRKFESSVKCNKTQREERYSKRISGSSDSPQITMPPMSTSKATSCTRLRNKMVNHTSVGFAVQYNNEIVDYQSNIELETLLVQDNKTIDDSISVKIPRDYETQTLAVHTKNRMTQTLMNPGAFIRFSTILGDQLHYFTGLDSKRFNFLLSLIAKDQSAIQHPEIGLNDQLLLTLFKYRHDNDFLFMQNIFMINRNVIAKIFKNMTNKLYFTLNQIDFWQISKSNSSYRAIIDCTEVPVQKSDNPNYHQLTFSSYKNKTTFKTLVAVDEKGLVIFVSDTFGGAISDREIFEKSGMLNNLERGDFLLADRGFEISDLLENKGVILNIPPFLRGKNQLTEEEIVHTRFIANRRIIVERIIGLAKINQILIKTIPTMMWPFANQIIKNVFLLCNLHSPIV